VNYGSDFLLDETGDIILIPEGEILTVSGPVLIAQDIKEEASVPYGSLSWDPEAGSHLAEMLNDVESNGYSVSAELERLALKDPRVDASTVKAERISSGKYRLHYVPLSTVSPESLYFDLSDLLGENNNG